MNEILIDIIGEPKMRIDESHKWREKGDFDKESMVLDLEGFKIHSMSLESELSAYKT